MSNIYQRAVVIRILAERTCDPKLYKLAANLFDLIGFHCSANRLRDREYHYKRLPNSKSKTYLKDHWELEKV